MGENRKPYVSSENPDFVAYSRHESESRNFELCLVLPGMAAWWCGGVAAV